MNLSPNEYIVRSDRTQILDQGAEKQLLHADVPPRPLVILVVHDDGEEKHPAQRPVAPVKLFVTVANRYYKVLLQTHSHQHLQVHTLPYAHNRRNQRAHKTDHVESIVNANARLLLQLIHRRVGNPKNNRDEGEERFSVDALPRPEKHNQHVEERLKCLDSVRQRHRDVAVTDVRQ